MGRWVWASLCGVLALAGLAGCVGTPRPAPGGTPPAAGRDLTGTLTFGGYTRTYLLHLPPAYHGDTPFPLVVNIHGGAGNAAGEVRLTGMNPEADRQGFLVVYPDGTGRLEDKLLTWNAGTCCGYALAHQVDDVGFVRALIAELGRHYAIDPRRVYATGMSNGGMMAYRLGCELADQIAAIAPVAGAQDGLRCRPAQPVAVIAFHGTADDHVPYAGGHGSAALSPAVDRSVAYAMAFWAQADGCAARPQTATQGHIVHDTYTGCTGATAVELYTVQDGGHAWPGGVAWPGGPPPTQEIAASRLLLAFFAAHPRP
ncbi:MAG TPA: PHB depolymerase family esterase [Chloroflexia bacterium]|nr:PHB depolymerase family esterase [Chloroflexia bacterium]